MPLTDVKVPNASADVVAVFDDQFNQVFENARPIKAMVMESSKPMEHPVEDGTTITDHRIILPVDIELSLILGPKDYRSVYQQLKQVFMRGTLLTVQTKTDSYPDMLMVEMPHDEDPEMYDAVAVALKLRRVIFTEAAFGTLPASSVADKSQASTVNRGDVQTTEETSDKGSVLYQWFANKEGGP